MVKKLTLGAIRTDGGTQVRVELDQQTFLEYGRQMKDGVKFPPADVFFDGSEYWLADGFHRFYGARESGLGTIDVKVHNGTVRDAILFAIGANAAHGKPRTNKDKRHAVEMLLADEKWRTESDRQIAERAAVGHSFVSSIRAELSSVDSSAIPEATRGKDGKRRRKPKRRKPNIPTPTFLDEEHHPVADDSDDDQDTSGGAAPVSSGPLAGMDPDPAGADSDGPQDRIAWMLEQLDLLWSDYRATFHADADWMHWRMAQEAFAVKMGHD